MAWTIHNRGLYILANNDADALDLRMLVLAGASVPAGTQARTLNFVSELLAVSGAVEAAASGYSRFDLAGLALTEVDGSNWVTLTWDAPVWEDVAVGETWRAVVLYREGASDAARDLIGIDAMGTPIPTNGSDVTYTGGSLRFVDGT